MTKREAESTVTCECVAVDFTEVPRALYRVTGRDGSTSICSYCDSCAALAREDWSGEVAAVEAVAADAAKR